MCPSLSLIETAKQHSSVPLGVTVVDDCQANLVFLTEVLRSYGFRVQGFDNGVSALKGIMSTPPDVLVLDVVMPEVDGFEICRQVKGADREDLRRSVVLFVSASNNVDHKLQAFSIGAADYMTKPIAAAELVARIRHRHQSALAEAGYEDIRSGVFNLLGNDAHTPPALDRLKMHVRKNEEPDLTEEYSSHCRALSNLLEIAGMESNHSLLTPS